MGLCRRRSILNNIYCSIRLSWFDSLFIHCRWSTKVGFHLLKILPELVTKSFVLVDLICAFCGIPAILCHFDVPSAHTLLPLRNTLLFCLDFLTLSNCFHICGYHTLGSGADIFYVFSFVLFFFCSRFDILDRLAQDFSFLVFLNKLIIYIFILAQFFLTSLETQFRFKSSCNTFFGSSHCLFAW